jgi:hypothetical protein
MRSLEVRFWAKVTKTRGCWLWTGRKCPRGYGRIFTVRVKGTSHTAIASRVAWELANGPIPPGSWVLHKCDNPSCVRASHLFLGNAAVNTQDMRAKGRGFDIPPRYGAKHHNTKFTPVQIREIRRRYATGKENQYELADAYGVCQATIGGILRGRVWSHVA